MNDVEWQAADTDVGSEDFNDWIYAVVGATGGITVYIGDTKPPGNDILPGVPPAVSPGTLPTVKTGRLPSIPVPVPPPVRPVQ